MRRYCESPARRLSSLQNCFTELSPNKVLSLAVLREKMWDSSDAAGGGIACKRSTVAQLGPPATWPCYSSTKITVIRKGGSSSYFLLYLFWHFVILAAPRFNCSWFWLLPVLPVPVSGYPRSGQRWEVFPAWAAAGLDNPDHPPYFVPPSCLHWEKSLVCLVGFILKFTHGSRTISACHIEIFGVNFNLV